MRLRTSLFAAIICTSMAVSCGDSAPASPTPTATPTPTPAPAPGAATRVIAVSGDLAFGWVDLGLTAEKTFTITNNGNSTLTFTSMSAIGGTGADGYVEDPTSGTIAPGDEQTITIRFTPTLPQYYSHILSIASDRTSGDNEILVSGIGSADMPLIRKGGF